MKDYKISMIQKEKKLGAKMFQASMDFGHAKIHGEFSKTIHDYISSQPFWVHALLYKHYENILDQAIIYFEKRNDNV